ncbi:MAG TPA: metal ABC transporter substrate-binding protein [Anaerolineaceae bacterium]|nr:metal ABC transporter substrate-binding protein [Anaerolineaceae bacterium]
MKRIALALLALSLLLAACTAQPENVPATGNGGPTVVATTTILADVVAQVGGERVAVRTLLPVGVDPHSFEPAPSDLATVAHAAAVFVVGTGIEEGFLDNLVSSAGAEEQVIDVSAGVPLRPFAPGEAAAGDGEAAHADEADPHVWFDPANVAIWAENVAAALSELDPPGAAAYAANAAAYRRQLDELDGWIRQQVDGLPPERRSLVIDHTVLGYFAAAYGFEQVGAVVPGVSSSAQPSAQDLARLEDTIRRLGVPAVFVGSTVNPALAGRVAEDTGARLVPIYTDSLSEPGGEAGSYLDYMRYNVQAIVTGLQDQE